MNLSSLRTVLLCLLASLLPLPVVAQPPGAGIDISFEADSVVVTGVPAESRVAWLGVGREPTGAYMRVFTFREVTAVEGNGVAQLALDRSLMRLSAWAAVVIETGELAITAPPGTPLEPGSIPPGAFVAIGASGRPHRLIRPRRVAEMLVVRPGAGAWGMRAEDGSASDVDGLRDNQVTVDVDSLEALTEGGGRLSSFGPGDVVVVMDPEWVEVDAVTRGQDN